MAKKIVLRLVDDLTGEDIPEGAGETVHFSYNGAAYEIDLSEENASELRSLISKYADAGRRVAGRRSRQSEEKSHRKPIAGDLDADQAARIRTWAEEQGIKVNRRGRISAAVLGAYRAAH